MVKLPGRRILPERILPDMKRINPFLTDDRTAALGPGTLEMAFALVEALGIESGMRVLEVGGGSGHVATVLAREWGACVVTLEPWHGGASIQARAEDAGVGNRVLGLRTRAEEMPFADMTFDAVLSINSFEMIAVAGDQEQALAEIVRVTRRGAQIGIAEPMAATASMPADLAELDAQGHLDFQVCFRTLDSNQALFEQAHLAVEAASYFSEAQEWWEAYSAQATSPNRAIERELIRRDKGCWLSLGLLVGRKA